MEKIFYALACIILVTIACATSSPAPAIIPTFDPNTMQTAIVSTALAAQSQTQTASISADNPTPTNIPLPTETPSAPLSLIYEGLTISCICNNCNCLTNVTLTARITIDTQGYVTGSLDKYLETTPPMTFEGTKENLLGSIQQEKDTYKFIGALDNKLSTLDATIFFEGTNEDGTLYSGQRKLLLFKK